MSHKTAGNWKKGHKGFQPTHKGKTPPTTQTYKNTPNLATTHPTLQPRISVLPLRHKTLVHYIGADGHDYTYQATHISLHTMIDATGQLYAQGRPVTKNPDKGLTVLGTDPHTGKEILAIVYNVKKL